MTRETKAGLVVSCSFLCLVGVVLYTKWQEGDGPAVEELTPSNAQAALTPPDPTPTAPLYPAPNATASAEQQKVVPVAAMPALQPPPPDMSAFQVVSATEVNHDHKAPPVPESKSRTRHDETGSEFTMPSGTNNASAPPPPTPTREHKSPEPPPAAESESKPPALPATGTEHKTTEPALPGAESKLPQPDPAAEKKPQAPSVPAPEEKTPPPTPAWPTPGAGTRDAAPSPATDQHAGPTKPEKTEGPGKPTEPSQGTPGFELPTPAGGASRTEPTAPPTPRRSTGSTFTLPDPPAPAAPANGGPSDDRKPGGGFTLPDNGSPIPAPVADRRPREVAPPPSSSTPGTPPNVDPGANLGRPQLPTPSVAPALSAAPPPRAPLGSEGRSFGDGRSLGMAATPPPAPEQFVRVPSAGQSLPPLGAPAAPVAPAVTPPVTPVASAQPPLGNVPQVDSYDEMTYRCRPNDSFATISREQYQTDRYAQALWLFNRNHPLATDGARQDPPVLQPGQAVYIPPTRILEKYYGSVIPAQGSFPAPGGAEAPRLNRYPATGSAAPAPRPASSAVAERIYHVQRNGETFYEIARHTLGTGERWSEIYKLNPRFDPSQPVPPGIVLRLPGDARLDGGELPRS